MVGMLRSFLNCSLKDALSSAGIPLVSEFKVLEIIEGEDHVTVVAEDGREESGSFLIGCDGLNSVVRTSVLKSHGSPIEPVDFTGIVQVCPPLPLENRQKIIEWSSTAQRNLPNPYFNAGLS